VPLKKFCSTIVGCSTCGSTSDKIEWYDSGATLVDGQIVETPKGDACLPCGLATEAYPLLDRSQVVIKCNTDPEFKKAFQVSRKRAETAPEQLVITPAQVFTEIKIGLRLHSLASNTLSKHRSSSGQAQNGCKLRYTQVLLKPACWMTSSARMLCSLNVF
jgi:hypothetical protein